MAIEIKAYECEHGCKKILRTKQGMKKHEMKCWLNPERKACLSCINMVKVSETVYNPHHGGDPGSTDYEWETYWCDAQERDLSDGSGMWDLRHDCEDWEAK